MSSASLLCEVKVKFMFSLTKYYYKYYKSVKEISRADKQNKGFFEAGGHLSTKMVLILLECL